MCGCLNTTINACCGPLALCMSVVIQIQLWILVVVCLPSCMSVVVQAQLWISVYGKDICGRSNTAIDLCGSPMSTSPCFSVQKLELVIATEIKVSKAKNLSYKSFFA